MFDERGQEVRLKLGPYKIGDTVGLKCTATGGDDGNQDTALHIFVVMQLLLELHYFLLVVAAS